jgi:hypothetical protein
MKGYGYQSDFAKKYVAQGQHPMVGRLRGVDLGLGGQPDKSLAPGPGTRFLARLEKSSGAWTPCGARRLRLEGRYDHPAPYRRPLEPGCVPPSSPSAWMPGVRWSTWRTSSPAGVGDPRARRCLPTRSGVSHPEGAGRRRSIYAASAARCSTRRGASGARCAPELWTPAPTSRLRSVSILGCGAYADRILSPAILSRRP